MARRVEIGLNGVIAAVTRRVPRVLVLRATDALPFGPFDPEDDRTLELGLRRWVRRLTGPTSATSSSSIRSGIATGTLGSGRGGRASFPSPTWR
jgi:hypothetical protein